MKLREISHFENFHILLWLLKDSCWMMEWKFGGTLMFFPTIFMAIFICYRTRKNTLALIVNLAVLCWISANSAWMFFDFYQWNFKPVALILFLTGLLFILLYLYKILVKKEH